MVPKILNYVETQKDTSLPVIKFRGPEELEEAFDAVGEWGLVLCHQPAWVGWTGCLG